MNRNESIIQYKIWQHHNFQFVFPNIHLNDFIPEMIVFSAHIKLNNNKLRSKQENLISKINLYLAEKYNIIESTIQITHSN